jgi:hypothetical protein
VIATPTRIGILGSRFHQHQNATTAASATAEAKLAAAPGRES